MLIHDRWPVWRGITISPLSEGDNHRFEIETLLGEVVLGVAVSPRDGGHQARLHEVLQPGAEDIGGQPQAGLEIGEPGHPCKGGVPEDEQAPPFPRDLQRPCRGAHFPVVVSSQHGSIVTPVLA